MLHRVRLSRLAAPLVALLAAVTIASDARAYINQADGVVVPITGNLQACLDRPVTGETTAGAVDAISDAAVLPEAFRPVANGAGDYLVTFLDIGEGAGFRNSFGWFWIGDDITDPANLHTVFGCRTYGICACPCATTRTVTVDFDTQPGFSPGRPIGFWLRTPERLDGSREAGTFPGSSCSLPLGCDPAGANVDDSCGGRRDTNNRIYFTNAALNDDGDYVHFLVYRSATRTNTYYFGFEDLFRGGDNDFEDMLVRGTGLVPICDPRPETCDGTDQDCDGSIDEGLTMACSTLCGAGTRTCASGSYGACSARVPSGEACNAGDDDCDGSIDEGLSRACSNSCGTGTEICVAGTYAMCSARTPTLETCNNTDDDCDTRTDEGLSRPCGSACGSGTQLCAAGAWGTCSAPAPGVESCNGLDDDCDGRVDEALVRDCTNDCGSGFETCTAGAYVGCSAPDPRLEACNALDDDCDGAVDEMLTRACSSACGVGNETCSVGAWMGCDAPGPATEICNNVDDDCNGAIDDGDPGGGAACVPLPDGGFGPGGLDGGVPPGDGGVLCANGRVQCIEGALVCRGATSGSREVCNCLDDDCDGNVDEDASGDLCPGGACIASECACADPCLSDEFPCPPGRTCDTALANPDAGIIGYCVAGRCAGVTCTDQEVCDADTGACENRCEGVTCGEGYACVRGACAEDNCYGRGCAVGELCRMPEGGGEPSCIPDACLGVTCGEAEHCRDGACIGVCAEPCGNGERCVDGSCQLDPCGGCVSGQSCIEGTCVVDECSPRCGRGRVCRGDACVDDPCGGVRCPGALTCDEGECVVEGAERPEGPLLGLAAGGGGCMCAAAGAPSERGPTGVLFGFALLGLALSWRRLRRGDGSRRATRAAITSVALASALFAGGCEVEPYCFVGCDEADGGTSDAGRDAGRVSTDGCVASGDETCNGRDDDCDGLIDESFDLETDPAHCGSCDTRCSLPHAFPGCDAGECSVSRCEIGWHDIDGVPSNGCEYSCPPSGEELCDGIDNDCDAIVDETFDLTSEIDHCGACGNLCTLANATVSCVASACTFGACRAGFVDLDGVPANGCEYRCTATGTERCNGVDDDCDRMVDEGFDLAADPANCGACGRACSFPHVTPRCAAGTCTFGPLDCDAGWFDVDGDPRTGCEYSCTPMAGADVCDGVDQDCDGVFDEGDPMVGTACGTETGACTRGTTACVRGVRTCAGGSGAQPETCDGTDEDCDGRTDESTAAAPIAGVGDRCGATDLGRCSYGSVACTGGALSCGGFVGPATETCNGIDDDCDGALDDGLTPPARSTVPSCAETRGVCGLRTPTCRGAAGWGCDLPSTYQATETRCDGLDNNCNGVTDEGCLRPTGTADVRIDTQDTASSANSLDPLILGSGSRMHVAWRDLTGGSARIYTSRSTDGGTSWTSLQRVDTTSGPTFRPDVALAGASGVAWAWPDFRGGTGYREIMSRRSTDSGVTLQPTVKVNALGTTSTRDSYNARLASSGTNVYAVYESFTSARSRHIFFARSTDSGATWGTPLQLSTPTGATFVAADPRIAVSGTSVYVVWRDNRSGSLDLQLRRSINSGSTFVAGEQRIDTGTIAGASASFSADIAANGTGVWVVWVDDRDAGSFDVWSNRSSDSGATWLGSAVKLDGDPLPHDSIEPQVVAPTATSVIVSWLDYRSGLPDVYATRSTNGGATWLAPTRIDTGSAAGAAGAFDLDLGASGSLIAAVWADDRAGAFDIYANFSLDGGANWQPQDYRLDTSTVGTSDSRKPSVWVGAAAFHTVWVDHRRGSGCPITTGSSCPNGDIYYRRVQ